MTPLHTWRYEAARGLPTSVVFLDDGAVLLAGLGGQLVRLRPESAQPEVLHPAPDTQTEGVRYAARGPEGALLLILTAPDGKASAVSWYPARNRVEALPLSREPRALAWSGAQKALWYTATDTSLNVRAAEAHHEIAGRRFNDVLASESGNAVVAREIGTRDVYRISAEPMHAERLLQAVEGELVGVLPSGELLVLKLAVSKKGGSMPDSTLVSVAAGTPETPLMRGPFMAAHAQGRTLAVIRRHSSSELELQVFNLSELTKTP